MTPTTGLPVCVPPGNVNGLQASDDTFIDANRPTTINGSEEKIEVRPDNGADRRGLLRFDIAGVVPSNATVTSAKLFLYETTSHAEQVTYVYRVTTNWSEGAATWNTPWLNPGGDFDNSVSYAHYIPNRRDCSIALDITPLVQAWANGTYPNYGVLLYSTGQNHIIQYSSKEESRNPNWLPRLAVTYTENPLTLAPKETDLAYFIQWLFDVLRIYSYSG